MAMLVMRVVVAVVVLVLLLALGSRAVDVHQLRLVAAKYNVTSIIVFGDSSVDPGNNNLLDTNAKGNFPPYGEDFFNHRSTGRLSNGRLATDFIAEALGYTTIIQGYLDPHKRKADLVHGVSFASAGSGYDDLTANLRNVLTISKQLEYFKHYKTQVKQMAGEQKGEEILQNAIYLLSMGTNDFLQNYFLELNRSETFTVEQYEDYLISCMARDVKAMYTLGVRRLVVVGLAPFGCTPLIKTLRDDTKCDATFNSVALSFNSKLKARLAILKKSLGMKAAYIDVYNMVDKAIQNPQKYGFSETSKGCCGTGTIEYAGSCKGLSTCADRTKYLFWDAAHFTEKMYKIIADEALTSVIESLLN
ncbi:unnamed protein product [Ilex paraguariensis]|uniref:GDSL esterase/lipase n=1 Tax=Ilex paraguariensis TaxID=185542 RepID=A0ABC8QSY5_9AQUA